MTSYFLLKKYNIQIKWSGNLPLHIHQLSTISLISPSMPCCTLKFLAKFLRNSSEEMLGLGNFSFLRACLITEPSIINSGVEVLSIGIFVLFCYINARNHKIVYPATKIFVAGYTVCSCLHYSSTRETCFSAAMRRIFITA